MNWNLVKLFLTINRSNSIQEAASKLKLSESTLFRQLNNLEEDMGKVFVRHNRSYALTPLGEELLPLAAAAEKSINGIERHVYGKDKKAAGKVRLTAPSSFSYNYLPSIIETLRERHPDIEVELIVNNQPLNLSAQQADIALRVTSNPPEHLVGKKVQEIGWGVYAGRGYLSQRGAPRSLGELAHHQLIGAAEKLSQNGAFAWLETHLGSSITVRSDDFIAMLHLAQQNHGVALLPDEFKHSDIVRLFSFEECSPNQLWLLTHPDMRKVKRMSIVMQHLLESLRDLLRS